MPSTPKRAFRHPLDTALPVALGVLLVAALLGLSLWQGLTWDEPWLMSQARTLAARGATEAFQPLAGVLLLPFRSASHEWLWGRLAFVAVQAGLGWALWRLMPVAWSSRWRWAALALLWLEPTFRERVLELRTDAPAMLLLLLATLAWYRPERLARAGAALLLGLALALVPKTIFWVVPWFLAALVVDQRSQGLAKAIGRLVLQGLAAGACAALAWAAAARWTGRTFLGLLQGGAASNTAALASHERIASNAIYYIKQVFLLGLPFHLLALVGLLVWLGRRDLDRSPWGHWELTGLAGALVTPFYAGAFPYHFVGVIVGLLPLAMRGFLWLRPRWRWVGPGILGTSAAFAFYAVQPVLAGTTLPEQTRLLALARAYLQPGLGYVDGVGMLDQPASGPFVTSYVFRSGQAKELWQTWEAHRAGLFILDGRVDPYFEDPGNGAWAGRNLVRVHRFLAVVGTEGSKEPGRMECTWTCPFELKLVLAAEPGSVWHLNGQPIQPGQPVAVPKGELRLVGEGSESASWRLAMPCAWGDPGPARFTPFFLPFRRL